MVAPYTDQASLGELHQVAFNKKVDLALRALPTFRSNTTKKTAGDLTNVGDTVAFFKDRDFDPQTAPLDEVVDPAGMVHKTPERVNVELDEYGNYTVITDRARWTDLSQSIEQRVAEQIAYNAVDSIDTIIQKNYLDTTPNMLTPTASGATVSSSATSANLNANTLRAIAAEFRNKKIRPDFNGMYTCFINPSVVADLRSQTDPAAWRAPHTYVDPAELYAWELGSFEGFRFIETPRTTFANGEHYTYFLGADALAEVEGSPIEVVFDGTIVDPLKRKKPVGWKFFGGWNRYYDDALYVTQSVASQGVITRP